MRLLWLLPAMLAATLLGACSDADPDDEMTVTVRAELVDDRVPARVEASTIREDGQLFAHDVLVTWEGEQPVVLDDARFTHHIATSDADLVIAGRGCGAQWDEETDQLLQACTADLQIIRLGPGETHAYPVRVYPEVGPLRLRGGTYVAEETIAWWTAVDGALEPGRGEPSGSFTIRLTYEVE